MTTFTPKLEHIHLTPQWLEENTDAIYGSLQNNLTEPQQHEHAVDQLLLALPYMLADGQPKRWRKLMLNALKQMEPQRGDKVDGQALYLVREDYVLIPQKKYAANPKAIRRRDWVRPIELFETYLLLWMMRLDIQPEAVTRKLIPVAIEFARRINRPMLYAKLYQTLSLVYARLGEHDHTVDFGRMAFQCWSSFQPHYPSAEVEMKFTATHLAKVYALRKDEVNQIYWQRQIKEKN